MKMLSRHQAPQTSRKKLNGNKMVLIGRSPTEWHRAPRSSTIQPSLVSPAGTWKTQLGPINPRNPSSGNNSQPPPETGKCLFNGDLFDKRGSFGFPLFHTYLK